MGLMETKNSLVCWKTISCRKNVICYTFNTVSYTTFFAYLIFRMHIQILCVLESSLVLVGPWFACRGWNLLIET
jgi:hypothetical protein